MPGKSSTQRVTWVDETRGFAMVLVLVSHFMDNLRGTEWDRLASLIQISMQVASPTFIAVSGLMAGLLYRLKPKGFAAFRVKLFDRGLFLLTVAHVVIALGHWGQQRTLERSFRSVFITDAIGLSILIGPQLVGRMRASRRVGIGLVVFAVAWLTALFVHPDGTAARLVVEAFTGTTRDSAYVYNFALLPWFAAYLVATALGEWLGKRLADGGERAAARALLVVGLGSIAAAIALKLVYYVAARLGLADADGSLYTLTTPFQREPPAASYLLFYAGIGLLCMLALLKAGQAAVLPRTRAQLRRIGQASLFMFVAQYYVYYTLIPLAAPDFGIWWPMGMVASIVVLMLVCNWWQRRGYNRLFTVGYTRFRGLDDRDQQGGASRMG